MTDVVQCWVKKKQEVDHYRFKVHNMKVITNMVFMKQHDAASHVDANMSEDYGASIFRVEPTPKTETAGSSKMLVPINQTT